MSSSDARRTAARGAVLGPGALAAFGVAGGDAWRPLELAAAPAPARTVGYAAADDVFAAFDVEALELDVDAHASLDAPFADAPFADALPDFLDEAPDEEAMALAPELSLARERALRDELAQAYERQIAETAARHEQELAETYAAGVEQGQAEGFAAAERMLAEAMGTVLAAREQLAALEDRWLANLDENVAVLAVGVARHLIGREIAADDVLVRERVAHAMAEFPLEQPLAVRVNPADLPALKAAADVARSEGGREVRWTADERIARGGCLVEGRERIVDGRVDTALERVYRRLSGQNA